MERPECRYRGAEDCRTEATEGDFTEGNVLMSLDLRREPKVIRSDLIQMGEWTRNRLVSPTTTWAQQAIFPISGEFHYSLRMGRGRRDIK